MVRLLVEHGADPNAKDHEGKTALDLAADRDDRDEELEKYLKSEMDSRS